MRWGKVVLIFQAIITLIIGLVFFSQLVVIDNSQVAESIAEGITSGKNFTEELPAEIADIKQRYTVAAWILFIISALELIIIARLIS